LGSRRHDLDTLGIVAAKKAVVRLHRTFRFGGVPASKGGSPGRLSLRGADRLFTP